MNVRLEKRERVYIKGKVKGVDEVPLWISTERVIEKAECLRGRDFSPLLDGVVRSMNKINDW